MSAKKKILLLATGGTIASKKSENGLKPQYIDCFFEKKNVIKVFYLQSVELVIVEIRVEKNT